MEASVNFYYKKETSNEDLFIHKELFPPDLSRVLQNIGDKLSESETEV